MPLPLLPIVVFSLVGVAFHQSSKRLNENARIGVLTPERQHRYEEAIRSVTDPERLRGLAKVYREQGLPAHADMLEKRANLRAMPEEQKIARRAAFRKALRSTNKSQIIAMANLYEQQGATGSAKSLRDYARTLPDLPPGVTVLETPVAVQPAPPPPAPSASVSTADVHGEDIEAPSADSFTEEEEIPSSDEE